VGEKKDVKQQGKGNEFSLKPQPEGVQLPSQELMPPFCIVSLITQLCHPA